MGGAKALPCVSPQPHRNGHFTLLSWLPSFVCLQCQDESCSSCQADFRKCTQCFTDSDPMPYLANGKCLMVSRVHGFCARLSLQAAAACNALCPGPDSGP